MSDDAIGDDVDRLGRSANSVINSALGGINRFFTSAKDRVMGTKTTTKTESTQEVMASYVRTPKGFVLEQPDPKAAPPSAVEQGKAMLDGRAGTATVRTQEAKTFMMPKQEQRPRVNLEVRRARMEAALGRERRAAAQTKSNVIQLPRKSRGNDAR